MTRANRTRGSVRLGSERALTRTEVIIILAVFALLAALLLPTLTKAKARALRIQCVDNLKQVGLAFRVAPDARTLFGRSAETPGAANAYVVFSARSNAFPRPSILVCPADPARTNAPAFGPGFSDWNISYFVNPDAVDVMPQTFLAGDRNLTLNGVPVPRGVLTWSPRDALGWTPELHVNQGNIAFADASVQSFSTPQMQNAASPSTQTNRLLIP